MARKAVRLSDIAEKLGVSTVTVSNALANQRGVSEELREKIKEMASEMGYHAPGTQIMAKTAVNIGVLVQERYLGNGSSFYWRLYQELAIACAAHNCLLAFCVLKPDEEKNTEFNAYLDSLDDKSTAAVYVQMMSIPTEEQLDASVKEAMNGMTRSDMETAMTQALTEQMGMSESDVSDYIADMSDEEITDSFTQMMAEQVKVQYAQQVQEQMSTMTPEELAAGFQQLKNSLTAKQGAVYYDSILEFSDSTYEDNLSEMGYVDLDDPSAINLYASSFANKDVITDEIENYNNSVEEIEQIQYTDYIGLMMSSITTIINTITTLFFI